MIIPLCALAPSWTFAAYAPYLVMAMGYGKLQANALCSVGGFLLLPMNLFCGYISSVSLGRLLEATGALTKYL